MKVFTSSLDVPKDWTDLHMAVGNFDGLHLGHQKLLQKALQMKRLQSGSLAVYSFFPHPQAFFQSDTKHLYLEKRETWYQRLKDFGVDVLIEEKFTKDFSELTAVDFLKTYWQDALRLKSLVVGEDFKFGHKRMGDFSMIGAWAKHLQIDVHGVAPVLINDRRVSTSQIKNYLNNGEVLNASQLLGRPFSIRGIVEPGAKKGRELGFPTLNLRETSGELLQRGVYLTHVRGAFDVWPSVTNVGVRPTVHDQSLTLVESHLLGQFRDNLYGQNIEVEFLSYLRPEKKFNSLEELKNQIALDVKTAEDYFVTKL